MQHVPYRGGAPAMQDMLSGQLDMMFDNISTPLAQYKAGKVKALAVTSPERHPACPELPTMAEFYPGFNITSWGGLCGPAGLPPAMVEKAAALTRKALAEREPEEDVHPAGRDDELDEPGRHRRVPPQAGAGPGADHQGVGGRSGLIARRAIESIPSATRDLLMRHAPQKRSLGFASAPLGMTLGGYCGSIFASLMPLVQDSRSRSDEGVALLDVQSRGGGVKPSSLTRASTAGS